MMLIRQYPHFHQFLQHGNHVFFFFNNRHVIHLYQLRELFRWTNTHSQFVAFSHPSSYKSSSNGHSWNNPANGWPYPFRSRGTTRSSTFAHDFGHFCRGRRIQTSGHSVLHMLSNLGPECKQRLHQKHYMRCFSVTIWQSWITPVTSAVIIWYVDEPCSIKLCKSHNCLLQCHHGARLCLCILVSLVPIPHFLRWQNVIKVVFLLVSVCFQNSSFLLLPLTKFHARIVSSFTILYPPQFLHPEFASLGHKKNLRTEF